MSTEPAATSDLTALSLLDAAELLRKKSVSPVELTRQCLERIEHLNPELNAFITVIAEQALVQARTAEQEIARGDWRGPLHGMPIALKDIVDTAGVHTTAGSQVFFANRIPNEDAEVAHRLKAAGAVVLGKLNLHEFAYGGSGLIGAFGPARNPWDPRRICGGSSSGSAAAVAARLCYAAIGTDTSGSIRLPAAFCGVVGFKPTYGLVSARGVVPLAWSYDHVGPMTRTVADAAAMLQVIAGYDPRDLSSRKLARVDYPAELERKTKPRISIARPLFFDELDPAVATAVEQAIKSLSQVAAEIVEVTVPVDTDRTVFLAESYAFHEPLLVASAELYQPLTLQRIRQGQRVTAAEYIRKRQELELIRRGAAELFTTVDFILTPTVPVQPPTIEQLQAAPEQLRAREVLMLRNTRPFNVLGLPTISVPCGFTDGGLPVGLQIAGRPGDDAGVLRLAQEFERRTDWRKRSPTTGEGVKRAL